MLSFREKRQLEGLIDGHGLTATLYAIAEICDEKAEHVAVNWQDANGAKPWAKAGARIGNLNSEGFPS